TAMVLLRLWCLVDGKSSSEAFPIDIDASAAIGDLKRTIKKESVFKYTAASELKLWRVEIPMPTKEDADTDADSMREITLSLPYEQATRLMPNDAWKDAIPESLRNTGLIPLRSLNLSRVQKAAITKCWLEEVKEVNVAYLNNPTYEISNMFGTEPPKNTIHVIVEPQS
ncbi:hypothetical protein BGX34_006667, partial [Mortierella sp. NVP85]